MSGDAKDADKQRRRAEALRANLKRRKAAHGERDPRGAGEAERTEAERTEVTSPSSTQGD